LPDFDALTPVSTGELREFSTSPRAQTQFYGFRYTTTLYAPTAEEYTFYTVSDDGSALYVNGELVVDNDGLHVSRERQGSINLAQGEHDIVVEVLLPYIASVVAPAGGAQGAVTLYAEDTASFDNCVVLADESTVVPVNVEAPANDLLVNPAFSNNLDGWFSCGGEQVLTTGGLNGGQSLNLTNEGCLFQEFTVMPGQEYSIACVGRSEADFSSVTYTEYNSLFTELDSQVLQVSNGAYQTSEFAITASNTASSAAITLYADTDASFDSCGVVITGGVVDPEPEPTVTPVDSANNLLTNGDFTNDGNEWLSCGGTTDIDTVGTGNSNAVTLGVESCVFQEFDVTPGSDYAVSCAASAIDFASLTISFADADFTQLASNEATVPGETLSPVQIAETAPANTARGAVTLYADQSAVFDDCVVVEL